LLMEVRTGPTPRTPVPHWVLSSVGETPRPPSGVSSFRRRNSGPHTLLYVGIFGGSANLSTIASEAARF
jgi:hypothetical protein